MSTISVRLSEEVMKELEKGSALLHLSKGEFVRRAITNLSQELKRMEHIDQLKKASLRVRQESMRVNADFAAIEYSEFF